MYIYTETINGHEYYRGYGHTKHDTYNSTEGNSVPNESVAEKLDFYKMIKIDSFKKQTINHVDISGNIIQSYQTLVPIKLIAYEFDEASWEASEIVPSISLEDTVNILKSDNDQLINRVSELQESNAQLEYDLNSLDSMTSQLLLTVSRMNTEQPTE